MEAFIIYLVKASGLLALFFIAYYTLLRKVTFFTSNRLFLLAGLLTTVLLPLLVYTKIIWITPEPAVAMQQVDVNALMAANAQAPVHLQAIPEPTFVINWYYVVVGIYLTGMLFFMGSFVVDLINVIKILRGKTVVKKEGFTLIDSSTIQSPFSFFNYIVYNSAILSDDELNAIFCHEKVHSEQKHSLDIILAQLFCIAFWFNPLAWLYKKAISQNLEFIADAEATKQLADKKAYQKTLLKITVQAECIPITNHFYQSLIKKRIVMLNKKHSKKRNAALYVLVVPALVAFVLLFQVEVVAQEKETKEETKTSYLVSSSFSESVVITNKTTDDEIKKDIDKLKSAFANADVKIDKVKRNKAGEIIAITVTIKNKNAAHSSIYEVPKSSPITPFKIEMVSTNNEAPVVNFMPFDKNVAINKFEAATKNADSVSVTASSQSEKDSKPGTMKYAINTFKTNGKDGLIIINGVKQKPGSTIDIPFGDEIDDLKVLKDDDSYGPEGKNGVIVITTKRAVGIKQPDPENWLKYQMAKMSADRLPATFNGTPPPRNYDIKISDNLKNKQVGQPYYLTQSHTYTTSGSGPDDSLKRLMEDSNIDYKKAYILINGREATPEELVKLDGKMIATISQIQANSQIAAKYGTTKAVNNGVISVTTNYKWNGGSVGSSVKSLKFESPDEANTGFLVTRSSQKNDLKQYTQSLKDMGIKLKYSGLEHNKEGEITSIKIELVDTKTGSKTSGTYSNTNGKGIQDVFVGRRNGELTVYAQ